jgi:hypothetical protein
MHLAWLGVGMLGWWPSLHVCMCDLSRVCQNQWPPDCSATDPQGTDACPAWLRDKLREAHSKNKSSWYQKFCCDLFDSDKSARGALSAVWKVYAEYMRYKAVTLKQDKFVSPLDHYLLFTQGTKFADAYAAARVTTNCCLCCVCNALAVCRDKTMCIPILRRRSRNMCI